MTDLSPQHHLQSLPLFGLLRTALDTGSLSASEAHTDPKQQRKLRQQQLQQKFRKEMEAKRLQQRQDAAKSEDTEVTIAQGSGGGKGSEVKGIAFSLTHIWKRLPYSWQDVPEMWRDYMQREESFLPFNEKSFQSFSLKLNYLKGGCLKFLAGKNTYTLHLV